MAVKPETIIWSLLSNKVSEVANQMNMPVAWPAEVFSAPQDNGMLKPFIRVGRVSGSPRREMLANGKPHTRTGFLVLSLVYPVGQSVLVYDQLAGTIAEAFTEGTCLSGYGASMQVTSYPDVQEGYETNGYWNVPVSIPWRTFL